MILYLSLLYDVVRVTAGETGALQQVHHIVLPKTHREREREGQIVNLSPDRTYQQHLKTSLYLRHHLLIQEVLVLFSSDDSTQ